MSRMVFGRWSSGSPERRQDQWHLSSRMDDQGHLTSACGVVVDRLLRTSTLSHVTCKRCLRQVEQARTLP